MRATLGTPLSPWSRRLWTTAQVAAFGVTLAVVAGLFLAPDVTLRLAWYGIVPLLPAVFLLNAGLWRGVCPIASANTFRSNDRGRPMSTRVLNILWMAGIGLLLVLIPLRHVLLNVNGPALGGLLVLIVGAAFASGWFVRAKGGFCNSICPILPVEKLYGQHPLIHVRNPRCVPCTLCSTKGCMDIDTLKAVHTVSRRGSGPGSRTGSGARSWLRTPMGLFAAVLPGVIVGYFLVDDVPSSSTLEIYGTVLGMGAASLVVLAAPIGLVNPAPRLVAPLLAALSAGLYYWFAAPASVAAFGGGAVLGLVVRGAFLALVVVWLVRALR
jgi:hypothetical protein